MTVKHVKICKADCTRVHSRVFFTAVNGPTTQKTQNYKHDPKSRRVCSFVASEKLKNHSKRFRIFDLIFYVRPRTGHEGPEGD
jgi:hypothetical protein